MDSKGIGFSPESFESYSFHWSSICELASDITSSMAGLAVADLVLNSFAKLSDLSLAVSPSALMFEFPDPLPKHRA